MFDINIKKTERMRVGSLSFLNEIDACVKVLWEKVGHFLAIH